jgi:hypothetical protein
MSSFSRVPRALLRHPSMGCEAVRTLDVSLYAFDAERIVLRYVLEGDLEYLIIPSEGAARRAHELWLHTCFEAFLGAVGLPGYHEFNFAPSRAWAMYRFSAPRQGMAVVTDARAPHLAMQRTAAGITLEATIFWRDLIPQIPPPRLRIAMAAVVEDEGGRLSYWALRHPPGRPDFHHPDSFTLELEL